MPSRQLDVTRIAYAHHEDDVVETMMLSLFYEGRLHTFSPVTHLDKTDLTVIRPLIYMRESEVIGFVHKYQIPVVKSPWSRRRTYQAGICQRAAWEA